MIETKKRSLILDLVLGAIILLIAFLFWPNPERFTQSNRIDRTKTQIKIIAKRINIRKEPSIESEDIGDVYLDEIYTVLDHIDKEDYYWYQIKTNQGIEGYIASNRSDEYVEVISGYVDRTGPRITCNSEYLVIVNDISNYDEISCEDEYSTCTLTYEKDPEYITFTGMDEDGNTTELKVKYYSVYNLFSDYYENNSRINSKFTKTKKDGLYTINTTYRINDVIESADTSSTYIPIIDFYDSDFNKLTDIYVIYNNSIPANCINNENYSLKEEYVGNDLLKGSTLCLSYTFSNQDSRIKYVSFGFSSEENYNNINNLLSSSYSKTFILEN